MLLSPLQPKFPLPEAYQVLKAMNGKTGPPQGQVFPKKKHSKTVTWWSSYRTYSLANLMTNQVGSYLRAIYKRRNAGWDPVCTTPGDGC